jgi:hypothetical protein
MGNLHTNTEEKGEVTHLFKIPSLRSFKPSSLVDIPLDDDEVKPSAKDEKPLQQDNSVQQSNVNIQNTEKEKYNKKWLWTDFVVFESHRK